MIETTCSDCRIDLILKGDFVFPKNDPSNTEMIFTGDAYGDDLLMWNCPRCEYPDSYDTTQDM